MKIRVATGNGTHTQIKKHLYTKGWHIVVDNKYMHYSPSSLIHILSVSDFYGPNVSYTVSSVVGNIVSFTSLTDTPSKIRTY